MLGNQDPKVLQVYARLTGKTKRKGALSRCKEGPYPPHGSSQRSRSHPSCRSNVPINPVPRKNWMRHRPIFAQNVVKPKSDFKPRDRKHNWRGWIRDIHQRCQDTKSSADPKSSAKILTGREKTPIQRKVDGPICLHLGTNQDLRVRALIISISRRRSHLRSSGKSHMVVNQLEQVLFILLKITAQSLPKGTCSLLAKSMSSTRSTVRPIIPIGSPIRPVLNAMPGAMRRGVLNPHQTGYFTQSGLESKPQIIVLRAG